MNLSNVSVKKTLSFNSSWETAVMSEEEEFSGDQEDVEYEYSDQVLHLLNVQKKLWQYIPPTLLLVGLVGNTLSLLVLKRPGMRSPSSVILMTLAVVDYLVLVASLPDHFLLDGFGIEIRTTNVVTCKLYDFIVTSLQYTSNWLIIGFTIFRVIAVYLPYTAHVHCSRKRAWTAILLVIILSISKNVVYVFSSHMFIIDEDSSEGVIDCTYTGEAWIKYYKHYASWFDLFVKALIPFFILLICNSMIIYKIVKLKRKRREMTNTERKNENSESMSLMLISISVLFIVTQAPFIISSHIEKNMEYEDFSREYIVGYWLMETALKLLTFVNNVANFFCYCISGKHFREEFVEMLREWKTLKKIKEERTVSLQTVSTVNASGLA